MRVLIIHNSYQQYGGEDAVVNMEADILAKHGNLAKLHIVSNNRIRNPSQKIVTALQSIFSPLSYRTTISIIRETKPDVVHVHNFFPLLSPSVFFACNREKVPVVFTLHNYRIFCPTALLMYNGEVTERSLEVGPWWALGQRVYRGSWIGTFLLCLMISIHNRIGTWQSKIDVFIVLSNFAVQKFSKGGLPPEKMVVKPNFVDLPAPKNNNERTGLLFVGRLSPEKGVDTLLSASGLAHFEVSDICIAGAGELSNSLAGRCVTKLGLLPPEKVKQEMQKASALLLPSVWYEGFPMVLVEAYANGLPVIASRIGALTELVEDGITGLLFEPGNASDLADRMRWALDNPEAMQEMGRAARQRYEDLFTPERNYEQLIAIYNKAIDSRHRKERNK